MTQSKKRALLTLIIWGLVFIGFSLIFFLGGGPDEYSTDKWRRKTGAIPIALGWLAYYCMLYSTRKRTSDEEIERDERDELIVNKANSVAFIMVLIFAYLSSITLWEVYCDEGQVPVGWMWFMSYSIMFVGFITSSISILFIEAGMSKNGQG